MCSIETFGTKYYFIYCIVQQVLKFSISFNQQLPLYLKKTWWKMYSLRPPLDLTKCLLALKDNWNIIALQQTSKPPQKQIEWLASFFDDLKKTCKSQLHITYFVTYYFCK